MSRQEETKPSLFYGSSKPPKRRNDDSSSSSMELRKKFVSFSEAERSRKPTVIYVETPEIIHADAQHFMSLVQKLTGKDSNSLNITNNNNNNQSMPLSNTTSSSSVGVAANSDQVTKGGISNVVVHQPSS